MLSIFSVLKHILMILVFSILPLGVFALWEHIGSFYEGKKRENLRLALIIACGGFLYYVSIYR